MRFLPWPVARPPGPVPFALSREMFLWRMSHRETYATLARNVKNRIRPLVTGIDAVGFPEDRGGWPGS